MACPEIVQFRVIGQVLQNPILQESSETSRLLIWDLCAMQFKVEVRPDSVTPYWVHSKRIQGEMR